MEQGKNLGKKRAGRKFLTVGTDRQVESNN
jgi:hypothetical protein